MADTNTKIESNNPENKACAQAFGTEFKLHPGGPPGFPLAVLKQEKVIAWLRDEKTSEHLAWSICFQEMLEEFPNQRFLELLYEYLHRLKEGA